MGRCVDGDTTDSHTEPGEEQVHVGEAEPEFRFGHTKVERSGKYPTGDGWWAVGLSYKLDLCHTKVKIRK